MFAAILPDGHWKMEIFVYYENKIFMVVHVFFKSITSEFGLFQAWFCSSIVDHLSFMMHNALPTALIEK